MEYYKNHLIFEVFFGTEITNYLDLRKLISINFITAKNLIESKKKLNKVFNFGSSKEFYFLEMMDYFSMLLVNAYNL